jgi:sialic acid synthase SpsE
MSGTAIKAPTKSEVENSHLKSFRRGTYVREKILAGTKLDDRQLIEKRPDNDGLRYIELIGKTVLRDLDVGEKIRQEDVY